MLIIYIFCNIIKAKTTTKNEQFFRIMFDNDFAFQQK